MTPCLSSDTSHRPRYTPIKLRARFVHLTEIIAKYQKYNSRAKWKINHHISNRLNILYKTPGGPCGVPGLRTQFRNDYIYCLSIPVLCVSNWNWNVFDWTNRVKLENNGIFKTFRMLIFLSVKILKHSFVAFGDLILLVYIFPIMFWANRNLYSRKMLQGE